jgi:hypothetical protein
VEVLEDRRRNEKRYDSQQKRKVEIVRKDVITCKKL